MKSRALTPLSCSGVAFGWCSYCVFFFFQAEDGIRDDLVTGVQTCALPICVSQVIREQLIRHPCFYRIPVQWPFLQPIGDGPLDFDGAAAGRHPRRVEDRRMNDLQRVVLDIELAARLIGVQLKMLSGRCMMDASQLPIVPPSPSGYCGDSASVKWNANIACSGCQMSTVSSSASPQSSRGAMAIRFLGWIVETTPLRPRY